MTTVDKIIHLISWIANVPTSNISVSTHIREDLDVDSIDFMLFIVRLEKLFNVSLSNEEVENIETVKDVSDYVSRRLVVA